MRHFFETQFPAQVRPFRQNGDHAAQLGLQEAAQDEDGEKLMLGEIATGFHRRIKRQRFARSVQGHACEGKG